MINVKVVPLEYIHAVWPKVEPFIKRSLEESTGDFSLEYLKMWILRGEQTLLVMVEEETIVGCGTVEFINYPNNRVAFITSCGGKNIVNEDVWQQVEDWCKSLGATKIQAWARDAQARLYKQKVGFTSACQIVEKYL